VISLIWLKSPTGSGYSVTKPLVDIFPIFFPATAYQRFPSLPAINE
jgi:hypothetical protein